MEFDCADQCKCSKIAPDYCVGECCRYTEREIKENLSGQSALLDNKFFYR